MKMTVFRPLRTLFHTFLGLLLLTFMKRDRKYRVVISDESHLCTVSDFSVSPGAALLWTLAFLAVVFILAGALIMLTPLRQLLPGYLDNTQRVATEENLMRLDSLQNAYRTNQAYIDNFLRVMDTERQSRDSATAASRTLRMAADSLLPAGERERRFVSSMEERERYNVSVLAPLAAEGVIFSRPCEDGIFASDSKMSETAVVITPPDSPVCAVADGTAVSVHYSPSAHGYELILQHQRGFLSFYTGTGSPLVAPGDAVVSGQAVASAPAPDRHGTRSFRLRLWHNGLPVVPYEYLMQRLPAAKDTPFEAPRGK